MNWDNRRASAALSEIDSLVTVAEYMGTQYDGLSNCELTPAKKDSGLVGEKTIGSLASEIQILTNKRLNEGFSGDKVNFSLFKQNMGGDAEDLGELTSLSEMDISNVHDTSLIQLEKDLIDTQ